MKTENVLVVKSKGGMGNRMLCAATGLLYGQITNRSVFVDWRDGIYAEGLVNAFPLFFESPSLNYIDEKSICSNAVTPKIWQGNLSRTVSAVLSLYDPNKHSSKFIHRKYSIDVRRIDYSEPVIVFWNYIDRINNLKRHFGANENSFQGLDRKGIIKKVLTEQMVLKEEIRNKIADFKSQNWFGFVIGVHVRYTDRKTSLAKYEKPISKLLNNNSGALIFLATDSPDVSKYFIDKYDRVISTPKWYPENSGALHSSGDCPDRYQSGVDALVDMYLLAECDGLVFPGNSTFSWISSILTNAPLENVFDVERWNGKVLLAKFLRESIP